MKIAFIGQKGIPAKSGGVEKHVEQLAVRMAAQGHEVTVYVRDHYTDKDLKEYQGVHLVHLPSLGTKHLDALSHTFLASLHALVQDYDIVHYQGIGPSLLSWIPRLFKPSTRVIGTFHSRDYFHKKWNATARLVLHIGEWFVCHVPEQTIVISETLRDYAEKKYDQTFDFVPNGAESVTEADTSLLSEWGLKPGRYALLVGRLVEHKGVHYAVKAFQELENTSRVPNNFKLVIVGGPAHTQEYETYLKVLVENSPNIILVGEQTGQKLNALFTHAALFIQPSEDEGLSLALLEAMGHGLLSVVSDIPANKEAISGGAGVLFESKNIADLTEKLAFHINRPEASQKIAEHAQERAEEVYSWDAITKRTLEIYRSARAHELALTPAKKLIWK